MALWERVLLIFLQNQLTNGDETHMAHALYTASQAASFIVSSPHSQLQKEDATKVQSFHETNTDYTSAQWVTI